jgi:GTPase SAR1 family protein
VLVGESNVGKTALVHRFVRNQNPPKLQSSTIGVEFTKRLIEVSSLNMKA